MNRDYYTAADLHTPWDEGGTEEWSDLPLRCLRCPYIHIAGKGHAVCMLYICVKSPRHKMLELTAEIHREMTRREKENGTDPEPNGIQEENTEVQNQVLGEGGY